MVKKTTQRHIFCDLLGFNAWKEYNIFYDKSKYFRMIHHLHPKCSFFFCGWPAIFCYQQQRIGAQVTLEWLVPWPAAQQKPTNSKRKEKLAYSNQHAFHFLEYVLPFVWSNRQEWFLAILMFLGGTNQKWPKNTALREICHENLLAKKLDVWCTTLGQKPSLTYPVILRILGFLNAPHLVGKCIIPGGPNRSPNITG